MKELVARWRTPDGSRLEMRPLPPLHPGDSERVSVWLNGLSANTRRNRFFSTVSEFSDSAVHKLLSIDPSREYLLVVLRVDGEQQWPIGGGRFVQDDDGRSASFSLLLGDEWQGQGIGRRLLKALQREAARRGLRRMRGDVLADNRVMLGLARSLHFTVEESPDDFGVLHIVCDLSRSRLSRWQRLTRHFLRRYSSP